MDGTSLITGSSNSSGYGGSATTTPTTPLGSYETRSLSTPTPTTVATVTTITPTAVTTGIHTMLHQQQLPQQHQSQHYNTNIPVATVAAVTPFYSEALNNIEMQQKQQQTQHQKTLKHTQLQRQQSQYYQPHTTNYHSTLYDSTTNTRAAHSMEQFNTYESTNLPLVDRSAVSHLRRHSVCLPPTAVTSNLDSNTLVPYSFVPPAGNSTAFSNTNNNTHANLINQNKIATSVVTTKPQATATPFYATTPTNLMSNSSYYESGYKYKIPSNLDLAEFTYNPQTYQQHPASYFATPKPQFANDNKPMTAPNYGVVPLKTTTTRQPSNLFEKYEKYIPNGNLPAMARGNYNTPFDSEIYARHKPHVTNNNANFLWNMEYPEFMPGPNPTTNTRENLFSHEKFNKYDKYNSHSAYFPPPSVNNMPQTMWPNTHYMERLPPTHPLPPSYHQQLPSQAAAVYHASPYMQQTSRTNYCATSAPYQQQQSFYASRRNPLPTQHGNNNGMLMNSKYADYAATHHTLPHHSLNKPKMTNDLHFGAATYDVSGAYNYATTGTTPNQLVLNNHHQPPANTGVTAKNCFFNELPKYSSYDTFNGMTSVNSNTQHQNQHQHQLLGMPNNNHQQMYVGESTSAYMRAEQQKTNYNSNYYLTQQNSTAYQQQQQQSPSQQQQQQQHQPMQQQQQLQQQPIQLTQQQDLMQIDYTQNSNCYLSPITNLEENCNVITNVANYADQYDINGTRSTTTATTFCNNNATNNNDNNNNIHKDNNNIIDNHTHVVATLGKNLSIRDFLTSWNDDEEDFGASVEDFSFIETNDNDNNVNVNKNKSVIVQAVNILNPTISQLDNANQMNYDNEAQCLFSTNADLSNNNIGLTVDQDANQYTNLPDIVIDIEKANTNTSCSTTTINPSTVVEPKSEFADFDVEMELDQLQGKRSLIPVKISANNMEKSDAFSKCLERADFNANIEANLRKVAEKLTAHIEERSNKTNSTMEDQQDTIGDRSAFEKEYKTFIHKIDTKIIMPTENKSVAHKEDVATADIQYKSETVTENESAVEQVNKEILSILQKHKRKLSDYSESECSASKRSSSSDDAEQYVQRHHHLWINAVRSRQKFMHYHKIVSALCGQKAYKNSMLKNKKLNKISLIIKTKLAKKSEKKDKDPIVIPSDVNANNGEDIEPLKYEEIVEKELVEEHHEPVKEIKKIGEFVDLDENSNSSYSSDTSSSSMSSTTTSTSTSTLKSNANSCTSTASKRSSIKNHTTTVDCVNNITDNKMFECDTQPEQQHCIEETQIDELEALKQELLLDNDFTDMCGSPLITIWDDESESENNDECDNHNKSESQQFDYNSVATCVDKQLIEEHNLDDDVDIEDKKIKNDKTLIKIQTESEVPSPNSIVSISSDVGEECYGFGSGEESEAFQRKHNERKELMDICQRLLQSPDDSSHIPKLSELCENTMEFHKINEINLENTNKSKVEQLLSVEEALAEMYRNIGVLSDIEENHEEQVEDTDEVLIINLQEILDGDSDVYLLQCNVNENIMEAGTPAAETLTTDTNIEVDDLELVQILKESNNEEAEVKSVNEVILDRNEEHMALGSEGTNSPEFVLTPIPSIHHEEIVPDNYIKYKKESFLKYLHSKYVQNHLSKFHCAHRILKKYKRRLPRKLLKNC